METKMKSAILPLYESSEKYLVKSKGCYLYDSEGKKYLDLEAGVWCANLGHSNPKITKVIKKEINTSIHHGSTSTSHSRCIDRFFPSESEKTVVLYAFHDLDLHRQS